MFRNPTEIAKTGLCSKESEYWSFGIACWELSQAANSPTGTTKESILPYKDVKNDEVICVIYTLKGTSSYFTVLIY